MIFRCSSSICLFLSLSGKQDRSDKDIFKKGCRIKDVGPTTELKFERVKVVRLVSQEWVQPRNFEHIADVQLPQVVAAFVDFVCVAPLERIHEFFL